MWRVPPGTLSSGLPYVVPTVSVSISGTQQETRQLTLSATTGGNPAPTVTYQWQRFQNNAWGNISGATGTTYTLAGADVGFSVRAVVTASNHMGTATASTATGTISARFSATGGSVTTADGYTYHTFYSSGFFTVEDPAPATTLEILMVGGGSGGSTRVEDKANNFVMGGGGGGGGMFYFDYSISTGQLYFEIGGGGGNRSNGSPTRAYRVSSQYPNTLIGASELNWVPTGGGRGETFLIESAGGSQWAWSGSGGAANARRSAGGGGGGGFWWFAPGGNGSAGSGDNGGWGGTGHTTWRVTNPGSGFSVCGGGGGGGRNLAGSGQSGGGTGGGGWYYATSGQANRGGGGGGGSMYGDGRHGNGGSGIVMVRYVTP